jgi:hypothetical protein
MATTFASLLDLMRVILGDREVHGAWKYSESALVSALRGAIMMGRGPTGYALVGNPFTAVSIEPDIKLGDDAALLVYDACLMMIAGEDGAFSFTTRTLSVNDKGERKSDLLWDLRSRINAIRGGGGFWTTVQSLQQYLVALPHGRSEGLLEQAIGQTSIAVASPLGEIVI